MFVRIAKLAETKGALLVIGSGKDAIEFYRSYRRMNERHAVRFIDPCVSGATPFLLDGPGSPAVDPDWKRNIALVGLRYEAVILARSPTELPALLTERLVDIHFHQTPVFTVEAFFESHWRQAYLHSVSPQWLFQQGFHLTRHSTTSHLKRLLDVIVSLAVLVFLLPLLILIAAAIRLESRGPAIFRQPRVGMSGRIFTIFKFRTMREAPEGDLYTRVDDDRLTRLGSVLRRTRLDELPQLWNVIRGEMSLVGPRAEWTKCAQIYEKAIPNYHLRTCPPRHHRLGPSQLSLRRKPSGHYREAPLRPLLHPPFLPHFGLEHVPQDDPRDALRSRQVARDVPARYEPQR